MRVTVLWILILLAVSPVLAQKTDLGIKLAGSFNSFHGNRGFNEMQETMAGYAFGVKASRRLPNNLSLSASLQYERTGSSMKNLFFSDPLGTTVYEADYFQRLDYLVLPVTLNLAFGDKNRIELGAGTFGGYLLKASGKIRPDDKAFETIRMKTTGSYDRIDFGLAATASYTIPLGKTHSVVIGFEELYGLADIAKEAGGKIKTNAHLVYAALQWSVH